MTQFPVPGEFDFLEEEGMDVDGMSMEEIEEAAEVFALPSGQYLMSFGCTSYHLEELVIHHRLYDACFLEVFSMKDTVGFFDMNSTVTYE